MVALGGLDVVDGGVARAFADTPVGIRAADGRIVKGHVCVGEARFDVRFHHIRVRLRVRRDPQKFAGICAHGDGIAVEQHLDRRAARKFFHRFGEFRALVERHGPMLARTARIGNDDLPVADIGPFHRVPVRAVAAGQRDHRRRRGEIFVQAHKGNTAVIGKYERAAVQHVIHALGINRR